MITLAPIEDLNKENKMVIRGMIYDEFKEYMRRYDIMYEDIYTKSQREKFIMFKALIIYELRKKGLKFDKIGEVLNRDHSSIVFTSQKYNKTTKQYDKKWAKYYNEWQSIKEQYVNS